MNKLARVEQVLQRAEARRIGRLGGRATTKRKVKAARRNGKLGGRPRQYPPCHSYQNGSHRFRNNRCPCGYVR